MRQAGLPAARSSQLAARLRRRYWLIDYIGLNDIGWVLNKADLVISRAGANTVGELAALGKPAILIPIPWTSGREQEKNARMLVEAGTAVILPQQELSGPKLLETISSMISNLEKFRINNRKAREKIKLDADKRIVQEIRNVLAEK